MRCTVCNHSLVAEIDLAILSGDYTLDQLSRTFGPSRSAFFRHSQHLKEKMRRCLKRLDNQRHQASFLKLSAVLDYVQKGIETSADDSHIDRVFRGSHIAGRLIHQLNNMDLPLEPDTAYRLLRTAGQASRDSILPCGPDAIADLHQALINQTLAPCPPPADDDEDETAAPPQPEDQPNLEQDLRQILANLDSKPRRRHAIETARKTRGQLRSELRRQKHLHNGKDLPEQGSLPTTAAPGEAQLSPAPTETRSPEPETPLPNPSSLIPDPCPLTPDHCPLVTVGRESEAHPAAMETPANVVNGGRESEAHPAAPDNLSLPAAQAPAPKVSTPATAPENKRDKSATKPKQQRRQLRKMLRHQRYIFKSKKLRQNFVSSRPNPTPPETPFPDPRPLAPEPYPSDPCPLAPEPCSADPCPPDETSRRADEPSKIAPGSQRPNPPKNIPYRRHAEDFHSRSIFGDVKKVLQYM